MYRNVKVIAMDLDGTLNAATGGNDESVYQSDFPYLTIDNYLDFPKVVAPLLR